MPTANKHVSPAKAGIATIAALATSMAALPLTTTSASAGDRGWHRDRDHRVVRCGPRNDFCGQRRGHREVRRHRDRDNGNVGAAIALGVIGTAIIAGALSQPQNPAPVYRHPGNTYPPAPAPHTSRVVTTYGSTFEPWSREWYNWCDNRYRSFNPNTGTYRGYDGRDHFCVVR